MPTANKAVRSYFGIIGALGNSMDAHLQFDGDVKEYLRQTAKILDMTLRIFHTASFQVKGDYTLMTVKVWFTFQHLIFRLPEKTFGFKNRPNGSVRSYRLHKRLARYINEYLQWGVYGRVTKRSILKSHFTWDTDLSPEETPYQVRRSFRVFDIALMKQHLKFEADPANYFLNGVSRSGHDAHQEAIDNNPASPSYPQFSEDAKNGTLKL